MKISSKSLSPSKKTGTAAAPTKSAVAAPAVVATSPHMMQLPPSPEFGSLQAPQHLSSLVTDANNNLSQHHHHNLHANNTNEPPRFRSVSNYSLFQPQAIACQNGITAIAGPQGIALFHLSKPQKPCLILNHTFGGGGSMSGSSSSSYHRFTPVAADATTSFVAPASTTKIANQSIGTTTNIHNQQQSQITNLQFQPNTLNLAAAYRSGILIWDASGQSLSPLLGRLGGYASYAESTPSASSGESRWFTSMAWTTTNSSTRNTGRLSSSTIATTTATTACLWDISSSFKRPALRFGTQRQWTATTATSVSSIGSATSTATTAASYVAVACCDEQVATLDSTGILRVYDIRMADRGTGTAAGAVSTFTAHSHGGVGLVALPSSSSNFYNSSSINDTTTIDTDKSNKKKPINTSTSTIPQSWMTWGFDTEDDALSVSACVKVWSPCRNALLLQQQQQQDYSYSAKNNNTKVYNCPPSPEQSDSYWFMDGGSITEGGGSSSSMTKQQQQQQQDKNTATTNNNNANDSDTVAENITPGGYKLVAQRQHDDSSHNLACARVCPSPLQNGIIIVGVSQEGSWEAKLYELDIIQQEEKEEGGSDREGGDDEPTTTTHTTTSLEDGYLLDGTNGNSGNFGLKKLASFQLGNDPLLRQALSGSARSVSTSHTLHKKDTNVLGPLLGAELTMMNTSSLASSRNTTNTPSEKKQSDDELLQEQELVVCCLSDDGYVTSYAIPEASCLKPSFRIDTSSSKDTAKEAPTSPVRHSKPLLLQMVRPSSDVGTSSNKNAGAAENKTSTLFSEHSSYNKNRGIVKDRENAGDPMNHDAALAYRNWNNDTNISSSGGTNDLYNNKRIDETVGDKQQQQQRYNNQSALLSPPPDQQQPLQSFDKEDDSVASISHGVEGGMMQFDMDTLGGAYGPVGPRHPHHGSSSTVVGDTNITPTTSQSIAQDGVSIEVVGMGHHPNLNRSHHRGIGVHRIVVNPNTVPVPRLCGAVFAPGGKGGLVRFHNGEVKKMWSWYQESNSSKQRRLPGSSITTVGGSAVPNVTGGNRSTFMDQHPSSITAATRPRNQKTGGTLNSMGEFDISSTTNRDSPRTLQDLRNMMIAAKEAQWGQDNDEAGSSINVASDTDDDSSAEDLYDDDSLGGSNSSDSDSEDGDNSITTAEATNKKSPKTGDELYESYFGQLQKPTATPLSLSSDTGKDGTGVDSFEKGGESPSPRTLTNSKLNATKGFGAGPSAEVLAPVVRVTHSYDRFVMNGQCPELAEKMKLGSWMLSPIYESLDITHHSFPNATSRQESTVSDTSDVPPMGLLDRRRSQDGDFTGYFQKSTSAYASGNQLEQIKSDPILRLKVSDNNDSRRDLEDATVRGGEMAVRPNRQESMVFLKKLFSQQGASAVGGMSTPPDAPMLPKTFTSSPVRRVTSSHAILQTFASMGSDVDSCPPNGRPEKLGVFTRDMPERRNKRDGTHRQLSQAKLNCLHNAKVCQELDQSDKADVWSLLAQMVDNALIDSVDEFSGWNEAGALGQGLLDSILRHYEKQGDVQMLASISCVLCCKPEIESKAKGTLLPGTDVERYDSYIRQYANLLYGWGLLTIRTELKKHLVRRLPGNEGALLVPVDCGTEVTSQLPGVDFAIICSRCHIEADKETNICPSCHNFAFRCSVCTNAVRGLFTICIVCGHGGHVDHVMPWFEKHSQCPTGCGCKCMLSTLPASQPQMTQSNSVNDDDDRMD